MVTDYTQPPFKLLCDLVNAANGTRLTPTSQLHFGDVIPLGDGSSAAVTITARAPLTGSITLKYQRVNLDALLMNQTRLLTVTGEVRLSELIGRINTLFALSLTDNDLLDVPLVLLPNSAQTIEFTVAPTSYLFFGKLTLTLVRADTTIPQLSQRVGAAALPGFVVPSVTTVRRPGLFTRFATALSTSPLASRLSL